MPTRTRLEVVMEEAITEAEKYYETLQLRRRHWHPKFQNMRLRWDSDYDDESLKKLKQASLAFCQLPLCSFFHILKIIIKSAEGNKEGDVLLVRHMPPAGSSISSHQKLVFGYLGFQQVKSWKFNEETKLSFEHKFVVELDLFALELLQDVTLGKKSPLCRRIVTKIDRKPFVYRQTKQYSLRPRVYKNYKS